MLMMSLLLVLQDDFATKMMKKMGPRTRIVQDQHRDDTFRTEKHMTYIHLRSLHILSVLAMGEIGTPQVEVI